MTYHSMRELLQRHSITYVETTKKSYTTKCPDCGNGYLSVTKKNDGVLWYCAHCKKGGGEPFEQNDNERGTKRKGNGNLGQEKALHKYSDESGKRLFDVVRFELPSGERQFLARKPD